VDLTGATVWCFGPKGLPDFPDPKDPTKRLYAVAAYQTLTGGIYAAGAFLSPEALQQGVGQPAKAGTEDSVVTALHKAIDHESLGKVRGTGFVEVEREWLTYWTERLVVDAPREPSLSSSTQASEEALLKCLAPPSPEIETARSAKFISVQEAISIANKLHHSVSMDTLRRRGRDAGEFVTVEGEGKRSYLIEQSSFVDWVQAQKRKELGLE
jgi:hypothetical protein